MWRRHNQLHDVTDRLPTAIGDFWLYSSFKHSLQWIAHILQYIAWSEPTCKSRHEPKELAVNTGKGICSPSLYSAHLSILKNIAIVLGSGGRMSELLDRGGKLCRQGDSI